MTRPMNYVDPPDVPEGMTLEAYRARSCEPVGRARRRARRRWFKLVRPRVAEGRPPTPPG